MKGLARPNAEQLMTHAVDITGVCVGVELQVDNRPNETVLHVNVDGVCVLRICKVPRGSVVLHLPLPPTNKEIAEQMLKQVQNSEPIKWDGSYMNCPGCGQRIPTYARCC